MTSSLERNSETLAVASLWKQELLGHLRPRGVHAASAVTFRDAVRDGLIGGTSNVIGVGYGIRITEGKNSGDTAVLVYVRKKLPSHELLPRDRIPPMINGLPTDVVAVGDINAGVGTSSINSGPPGSGSISAGSARDTLDPAECGISGAHHKVFSGTIGCVVRIAGSQADHLLSCNHVFANANYAFRGEPILQASCGDGGTPPALAELADFEPLTFADTGVNLIDAAIASIQNIRPVLPTIRQIGAVEPPMAATLQLSVKKHGRTSDLTTGRIIDIAADISVSYSGRRTANFEDQLAIQGNVSDSNPDGKFGRPGDSGSLVVDDDRRAVGLLFAVAAANRLAYANPIGAILTRFAATIV